MYNLLFLFVIAQIGLVIRYTELGIYNSNEQYLVLLLLVGAGFIFIMNRRQSNKDFHFIPSLKKDSWQTRLVEKSQPKTKKLTKGEEVKFYYKRYFPKLRYRIFTEWVDSPSSYLFVTFWNESKKIDWIEHSRFSSTKVTWDIMENDIIIGKASYIPKLKEVLRFEDKLEIELNGINYTILGYEMSSQVKIIRGQLTVGEADFTKLINGNVNFTIADEQEEILATAVIMFYYFHKNK